MTIAQIKRCLGNVLNHQRNNDFQNHLMMNPNRGLNLQALRYLGSKKHSVFKEIKACYIRGDFESVRCLVVKHIGVLLLRAKTELILYAALSSSEENEKERFMLLAVIADSTCLNGVNFSILRSRLSTENTLLAQLQKVLEVNSYLSPYNKLLISIYLNEGVASSEEYRLLEPLTLNQKVYLLSLLSQWGEISQLKKWDDETLGQLNKNNINLVFKSFITMNLREQAELVMNSEYSTKIRNGEINSFYFTQGDFIRGYKSMARRDLAILCRRVYPNKYIQSLDKVHEEESLLVLNSWGVGDDLRFATLLPALKKVHANITISCDPRIEILLKIYWPEISFSPSKRVKRLSCENYSSFSQLEYEGLHHLMDNELQSTLGAMDKVTLITDLIPELYSQYMPSQKSDLLTERFKDSTIDDFLYSIRSDQKKVVGICWRSMVQRSSRNEHYFSMELLKPLFELKGVVWVSLQYDCQEEELEQIKEELGIEIFSPPIDQINDFQSVSCLMQQLDIIVSAGTAVLELAGLSGTRTIALSNSPAQNYRINGTQDRWFDNIEFIENCVDKTKEELVEAIVLEIDEVCL